MAHTSDRRGKGPARVLHAPSLLDDPSLGQAIIERLSALQTLPQAGIVAGQSVSSAIDEILGIGRPVYNDIDVFMGPKEWKSLGNGYFDGHAGPTLNGSVGYGETEVHVDGYDKTWRYATRVHYSVEATRMDGLVNQVRVTWQNVGVDGASRVRALLNGFDTNNVQVGLDLRARQLVRLPAYDEFFRSRELRIEKVFTPIHSLLRFMKKKEELGLYGHSERHLEFIRRLVYLNELDPLYREARVDAFKAGKFYMESAAVRDVCKRRDLPGLGTQRAGEGVASAPLAFGHKYLGLFERFAKELEPYFELTPHAEKNVWLASSRIGAPRLQDHIDLPFQPSAQSRKLWQLGLPASKLVRERREAFQRFVLWLPVKIRPAYENAYRIHGDDYLVGCESQTAWRELQAVVSIHPEFRNTILPLPMHEQISLMRLMRRVFRKEGAEPAWGLFAGKTYLWALEQLDDPEAFAQYVHKLMGSTEPLVDPAYLLPLPAEFRGAAVTELNSDRALIREGNRMRHCVGGYGDVVRYEDSRIISVRLGESRMDQSTLEWGLTGSTEWPIRPAELELRQHHSYRDEWPSEELEGIEDALRGHMETWLRENVAKGLSIALRIPLPVIEKEIEQERLAAEACDAKCRPGAAESPENPNDDNLWDWG